MRARSRGSTSRGSTSRGSTSRGSTSRGSTSSALPWAFLAGLVAMALHLRAPFVAVAPVADRLRDDLGVGAGALGLLTTLPVLCFALATPLALAVARRTGPETAASLCLAGIVTGALVRSLGSFPAAVAGSVVIGVGITVGNVVTPVLIRRWVPPDQVGMATGIWVSALNVGSMVVTFATDPLARVVGWQGALLVWGLAAGGGLAAWEVLRRRWTAGPAYGDAARAEGADPARPSTSPVRELRAWLLALAFACQAASYYGVTAWLPQVLTDRVGLGPGEAGAVASVFQVCAVIGALGVPLLARRRAPWVALVAVGVLWAILPLQLIIAPGAYLVGAVLGGVAQGGGLSAVFAAVAQVARTDADSARLSAFVQGVGYAGGASWPLVLGLAHDRTDAWTLPLLLTLGTTTAFLALGLLFHRADRRQMVRS